MPADAAEVTKQTLAYRYLESQSEIKDDLTALVSCLKSGTGALTRLDASSLLWHHALSGDTAREALASAGIAAICTVILGNPASSPVDQTSVLGVLFGLATGDLQRDTIFRSKDAQGRLLHDIIISKLAGYTREAKYRAIGMLRQLSENFTLAESLARGLQQSKAWPALAQEASSLGHPPAYYIDLACLVRHVVDRVEGLKVEAGQAGLVKAMLVPVVAQKAPQAVQACLECLEHLLRLTANQQQAAQAGAVPVFLALIGPPPRHIVELEQPVTMQRTFTFSPASAASTNGREPVKQAFMETCVQQTIQAGLGKLPIGQCVTGLGWSPYRLSMEVQSAAAACLACLTHQPHLCIATSRRAALQRLVPVITKILASAGEKSGGKGKKAKSLALTGEQETLLAKVTGLIRFLTMLDVNKARLAKLGAVPALITLVNKASRATLRYNARSILSNVAMLEEAQGALQEAAMPPELGTPGCCMQLHPDDVEELRIEDIALTSNSVVRAKHAPAWQKLQLQQLRRAVYTLTPLDTPHSIALDKLTDKLTGKNPGKEYVVNVPGGMDFLSSGVLGKAAISIMPAPLNATVGPLVSEFQRTSITSFTPAKGIAAEPT